MLVHKMKAPKKFGPKSLVKIGLVTDEILLIWTNVVSANVVWTNVTGTVGNFSRCSTEPTLKVSLKWGQ